MIPEVEESMPGEDSGALANLPAAGLAPVSPAPGRQTASRHKTLAVPGVLVVSLIFFLLGSSLLTFLLLLKSTTPAVRSSAVPAATLWTPGEALPRLRLSVTRLDLGAGDPGSITRKNITLINAGAGEVHWQAKSNVAWLSLNPTGGAFPSMARVELTVNRANLSPQAYLGQVAFTQSQGLTQTLYVSMTVDTPSV